MLWCCVNLVTGRMSESHYVCASVYFFRQAFSALLRMSLNAGSFSACLSSFVPLAEQYRMKCSVFSIHKCSPSSAMFQNLTSHDGRLHTIGETEILFFFFFFFFFFIHLFVYSWQVPYFPARAIMDGYIAEELICLFVRASWRSWVESRECGHTKSHVVHVDGVRQV